MKIQGADPNVAALQGSQQARATDQADKGQAAEKAGLAAPAGLESGGSVQLSQQARDVTKIQELARAEPEVRADVVDKAKADLAAGRLDADPMALAEMISRDIF
jgi:flagellar biosynthesis anti-sigma factor FlgM